METEVVAAIVGAIGGLVSGATAAWATIKAKRLDRVLDEVKLWVSTYDTKLLEQRLTEYRRLWRLSKQTSRLQIAKLTPLTASALADALTDWYYNDGGMILSGDARDRFFSARASLEPPASESPDQCQAWHAKVVSQFSALRTALCEDMNSRRGPTLRSSEEKDTEQEVLREARAD